MVINICLWFRIQQAELLVHNPQLFGIFFSFLFLGNLLLPFVSSCVWTKASRHFLILFVFEALFNLFVIFHAIWIISSGTLSFTNFLALRFLSEWPLILFFISIAESFFEDLFTKCHTPSGDDILSCGLESDRIELLVYIRVVSTKRSPGCWVFSWRRIFLLFSSLSSNIWWNLLLLTRAWFRVNALDSIFRTHERWLLLIRR